MKYSIDDLKKVHYQALNRSGGYTGRARISVNFHFKRPNNAVGRNDININQQGLGEMKITNKETLQVMAANFPEKKIQVIFDAVGLSSPSKIVNIKKGGGITFGIGGLLEQFAKENGYTMDEKKNYFKGDLSYELSYEQGRMKAFELTLIRETVEHSYRD